MQPDRRGNRERLDELERRANVHGILLISCAVVLAALVLALNRKGVLPVGELLGEAAGAASA